MCACVSQVYNVWSPKSRQFHLQDVIVFCTRRGKPEAEIMLQPCVLERPRGLIQCHKNSLSVRCLLSEFLQNLFGWGDLHPLPGQSLGLNICISYKILSYQTEVAGPAWATFSWDLTRQSTHFHRSWDHCTVSRPHRPELGHLYDTPQNPPMKPCCVATEGYFRPTEYTRIYLATTR